jgi:hypothetical protein
MLKIIIIIIVGYTLNNFIYSYHNIIVDDEKICNFKIKKTNSIFFEKTIIRFVNMETHPRL